jgi:hypothetical protein
MSKNNYWLTFTLIYSERPSKVTTLKKVRSAEKSFISEKKVSFPKCAGNAARRLRMYPSVPRYLVGTLLNDRTLF